MKIALTLLVLSAFALVSISSVAAIGYAPLGVEGRVLLDGAPVEGAEVWLKAFIDGEEVAVSEPSKSIADGSFYALLTVPDGVVVDVQITVEADQVYVELLQGSSPWQDYDLVLELSSEEFTVPASSARSSPTTSEFEEDFRRIVDGEAADDEGLRDKYDLEVVPVPEVPPVVEQPGIPGDAVVEEQPFLPAPQEVASGFAHGLAWKVSVLLVIIVCLFFIRYELRAHRRS